MSFSIARRVAGLITVPRLLPAAGPIGMRSHRLMTIALRVMGNLITDEDRVITARVWRWAGRQSVRLDDRPPFILTILRSARARLAFDRCEVDAIGEVTVVDLGARPHARVDPYAGPGRLAVGSHRCRRGQEAGSDVFRVDAALDRVPAQGHVVLGK